MYDLSHRLASLASTPLDDIILRLRASAHASPRERSDAGEPLLSPAARLDPRAAHRFRLHHPRLAGAVVWNAAGAPLDPRADELLRTVTGSARRARGRAEVWASEEERRALARFLPPLGDEAIWTAFAATWDDAIFPRHILPFVRGRGWPGAAVVVHGALMNVVQEMDDARAVARPERAEWTLVGLVQDGDAVLHGFAPEAHRAGRTVCACLSDGPVDVTIYRLR